MPDPIRAILIATGSGFAVAVAVHFLMKNPAEWEPVAFAGGFMAALAVLLVRGAATLK